MADPTGSTDPGGPSSVQSAPVEAAPHAPVQTGIWHRIKEHKVVQWTLAYAAAAYTLLHGTEMISEAMEWPHLIARVLTLALVLGVPLVITLAWYHGAKSLRRVSGPELTIITILLVIAGIILWALGRTSGEHAVTTTVTAPSATSSTTTSAGPRTSIAVMPFANLTGDASKDYLGDGMSEELINVLTKVPGLTVPSRTSSFAYKGRNTDLKQIAKDLGVGTILEGSVRSAGTTIRVTAQLIDAQSDRHLWSETYDRKFTDLFKLQDDLAKAIVTALQLNLNSALPAASAPPPPTDNIEAYQLYLQARSAVALASTEQGFLDAMSMYKQALALDPRFARAYAGLATSRLVLLTAGWPLENALGDAERDARHALALDPTLGQAHAVLGSISALRGRWLEADTSFRAAMSPEVGDPQVHGNYAVALLESVGYMRRSLAECREAYRLAPADVTATLLLSATHSLMGFDADALKFANLAVKLGQSPNRVPLPQVFANAAARDGHYAEAAERTIGTMPPSVRAAGSDDVIRRLYAALGAPAQRQTAAEALRVLVDKSRPGDLDATARKFMIQAFTQLGSLDDAFNFANKSLDYFARSGTVGPSWGVLWLPETQPFRRDPRFQALVTRMGLMEFWQQNGPPDDCDLKDGKLTCR